MSERFGIEVAPSDRRPVAWYAPTGLARVAREQLWSLNLLRNLDRRETFSGRFGMTDLSDEAAADGNYWLDFIADTGDGGSATTAVAQAMLAPRLRPEGLPPAHAAGLPTAQLLLLGGDLAYPGASPAHYQARLVEPFELARPQEAFDENKVVVAIPQNHDWLDSLSTFCRYFVNDRKAGLLGARAPQTRSYVALALPHGWFLLGLDFALTGDLDRGQFDAFRRLVEQGSIPPGAPVILVYPEPYWTREIGDGSARGYPKRYQRLEALLMERGCEIHLRLAGDLHHYVHETVPEEALGYRSHFVTCGSGGAFGHPTHCRDVQQRKFLQWGTDRHAAQDDLHARVFAGRSEGTPAQDLTREQVHRFDDQRVCYPEVGPSRRRAWLNLVALLRWTNLGFALVLGTALAGASFLPGAWWTLGLVPGFIAAAFVATENDPGRARLGDWLGSLPLLGGVVGLGLLIRGLDPGWLRGPAAVLGSALLFGGFLALMSAVFGRLPNNASSALPGELHKGFLRLRVHAGGIEVFMLGLDRVPTRWRRADPGWPRWQPIGPPPAWRVVDRFEMPRPQQNGPQR
jgi:hypothetical protein